jgi:hypothetical protein
MEAIKSRCWQDTSNPLTLHSKGRAAIKPRRAPEFGR